MSRNFRVKFYNKNHKHSKRRFEVYQRIMCHNIFDNFSTNKFYRNVKMLKTILSINLYVDFT